MSEIPKVGMRYLNHFLPSGWERLFTARKAGKYYGLTVQCPVCSEKPPRELKYGGRKWRWLAAHISKEHA